MERVIEDKVIAEAKQRMERILEGFEPFYDSIGNLAVKVPLQHPQIIGKGTTSIVFALGEFPSVSGSLNYLCGKVSLYYVEKMLPPDYVALYALPPGHSSHGGICRSSLIFA